MALSALGLVGVSVVTLAAEERLRDEAARREAVALTSLLAKRLRETLRDAALALREDLRAPLMRGDVASIQSALPQSSGGALALEGGALAVPEPTWGASGLDDPSVLPHQRAVRALEAQGQTKTALKALPPSSLPQDAFLRARLLWAQGAEAPARALDRKLASGDRPALAHWARLRLLDRAPAAERPAAAQAALSGLSRSGGEGLSLEVCWGSLRALRQHCELDAPAKALRARLALALDLRALDLHAGQGRELGEGVRVVSRQRGAGWLLLGPLQASPLGRVRPVLAQTPPQVRATLASLLAGQAGGEGYELLEEGGEQVWPGLSFGLRERETSLAQALARQRRTLRLALISGLSLLGAFTLWLLLGQARRESELAALRADFVASVTHELRTPLASIRAMSDVLALGKVSDPAEQAEFLEAISEETRRLARLVDDVLDVSRIERGTFTAQPLPQDLATLVAGLCARLRPQVEEAGYTLEASYAEDLPPAALDAVLWPRALENLLQNAIRYSGGARRIELRVEAASAETLRVLVQDQGVGIPSREAGALFQRFVRGSSAEGTTGTGLGLWIAREIALAHGGELTLKPTTQGACFELSLPTWSEPA